MQFLKVKTKICLINLFKCKEIKTKEQYTNEFHKSNFKIIKIKIKILEIEIKVFENPNLKFRFGIE